MDIPQLIIGTFQNKNYSELYQVVSAAVEAGFTGFDTAPSYETEAQLGKAINEIAVHKGLKRTDFYISDKVDGWQMRKKNGNIESYVNDASKLPKLAY